ncbi:hypothetical protein C823_001338 [Eubacterium plexicaudatum ASF492]|nr:hypothetical protein C823_001338 [Eubacterium plexicaudatum ASF492]
MITPNPADDCFQKSAPTVSFHNEELPLYLKENAADIFPLPFIRLIYGFLFAAIYVIFIGTANEKSFRL